MKDGASNRGLRILFLLLMVVVIGFAWMIRTTYRSPAPGKALGLNEVLQAASNGQIQSATFLDEDAVVTGKRCLNAASPPCPVEDFHASTRGRMCPLRPSSSASGPRPR